MAGSALDAAISETHQAVAAFLTTARQVPASKWNVPIAPGKWTPAQIVEHVALSFELAKGALTGAPGMGALPWFLAPLRPLARTVFFNGVLRKGTFPKASKGPPVFAPSASPPSLDASAARMERAVQDCILVASEMIAKGTPSFVHGFFGRITVSDYVRFGALHARHHENQLVPISSAG